MIDFSTRTIKKRTSEHNYASELCSPRFHSDSSVSDPQE